MASYEIPVKLNTLSLAEFLPCIHETLYSTYLTLVSSDSETSVVNCFFRRVPDHSFGHQGCQWTNDQRAKFCTLKRNIELFNKI